MTALRPGHLPEIWRVPASVGLVELAALAVRSPETLRDMSRNHDVLVCDAAVEEDLHSIAKAGQVARPMTVVGRLAVSPLSARASGWCGARPSGAR